MADEAAILKGEEDERGYVVPPAQSDAFNAAAQAQRQLRDKILALGEWYDEARYFDGDNGSLTTNIPIHDLDEKTVTAHVALLRSAGFTPEITTHEDMLRLRGADFEKFNEMRREAAAEKDEFAGLDFIDPRVTPEIKLMSLGVWHDARLESGGDVTRVQVDGKSPVKILEVMETLRDAGFHPRLHRSQSLGATIRLVTVEAHEIQEMRKNLINSFDWSESDKQSILATIKGGPVAVEALRNAMKGEGIRAYFPPVYGDSHPWGGVTGEDRTKVEKIQSDIKDKIADDNSVLRLYKPATAAPRT